MAGLFDGVEERSEVGKKIDVSSVEAALSQMMYLKLGELEAYYLDKEQPILVSLTAGSLLAAHRSKNLATLDMLKKMAYSAEKQRSEYAEAAELSTEILQAIAALIQNRE